MKIFVLGFLIIFFEGLFNTSFAAITFDWNGSSTNWAASGSWNESGGSGDYPGSGGRTSDIVRFGVSGTFTLEPTLTVASGSSLAVASIEFGGSNLLIGTQLTVNGGTLNVGGSITQDINTVHNGGLYTYLLGTGTINCIDIDMGSGTSTGGNNNYLLSDVATLNVSGNVNLISNVNLQNGSGFRLEDGDMYLSGQVLFATVSSSITASNATYFTINTVSQLTKLNTTPHLYFLNSTAIPSIPTPKASVNLYGDHGGTGDVTYTASSPTIYTTSTPGFGTGGGTIDTSKSSYDNLTIQATGIATVGTSTKLGVLNIAGNLTTNSTTTFATTTGTDTQVGGNWTNTSTVTEGTGSTLIKGTVNNSGTLNLASGVLDIGTDLNNTSTINASSGAIYVDGNATNTANLTLSSGNVYLAGGYSNSSTGVFTAGSGAVNFTSTDAQSLVDNSTAIGTVFNTVNFTGGGAKTMSGSGGFGVSGIGVLTMSAGNTLATGGILTLYSTSTSTATVAAMASNASISGNVNVQRYFKAGPAYTTRNYRILSSTVNNGSGGYNLTYLNNKPGVFVAGPTGTAGDFTVSNATSTIYLYQENITFNNTSFNDGNFKGLTNISSNTLSYYTGSGNATSTTTLPVGNAFFLYYCGNNTANVSSTTSLNKQFRYGGNYIDPDASTTTQVGTLNQQSVAVKLWWNSSTTLSDSKAGYNLVGNPYASSIDWDKFNDASKDINGASLSTTLWLFNYSTRNYGTYQANGTGGVGTNNATHVVASGQGFFVVATATTGAALTFTENCKTNVQPNSLSPGGTNYLLLGLPKATAQQQVLRLKVSKDSADTDDIIVVFETGAKNTYEKYIDADRLPGVGNISTLASYSSDSTNSMLAINHMHSIDSTTKVKLYVNVLSSTGIDTLSGVGFNSLDPRYDVFLLDHYKKDSLQFSAYPKYLFNINNADTSSYGANRFEIVFHKKSGLAYKLLSFTAAPASGGIQLTWRTLNEQNLTGFQVEREDGSKVFVSLNSMQSDGSGTYTYIDKTPLAGTNYYRLLQDDAFDEISYSNIISVNINNTVSINRAISLYPNPVSSQFNVKINTNVPASVMLKVTNAIGQTIISKVMDGNNIQQAVSNLLPGSYIVQVTDESNQKVVGVTQFIKE